MANAQKEYALAKLAYDKALTDYTAMQKALNDAKTNEKKAQDAIANLEKNKLIVSDASKQKAQAFIKAYKFTQTDHEKTIQDVKQYIDIEDDLINVELYDGFATSSPDPDKQGTIELKNTIVELGYTEDYDIEPLYNTSIYEKALNSILAEEDDDIYKSLQEHFNDYE